jgi:hypothetical protein
MATQTTSELQLMGLLEVEATPRGLGNIVINRPKALNGMNTGKPIDIPAGRESLPRES